MPGSALPVIAVKPSRFVVVIEAEVSDVWQKLVSEWMVESGCLYMMAWGRDCSIWHDAVDSANIEKFADGSIPDDEFVMTTWHEDTPLKEVFWYSKAVAMHPYVNLVQTIILHIASESKKEELQRFYKAT
jgi:hypothetical protein